jgi:hypothetical protein
LQSIARVTTAVAICLAALMLALLVYQNHRKQAGPNFTTAYQAVLLTNGQVFFGRLEHANTPFPILREAFYVRSQVNSETKQATSTLVKRGHEWHAPDAMILNASHILVIEPVAPDSQIGKFIAEKRFAVPSENAKP